MVPVPDETDSVGARERLRDLARDGYSTPHCSVKSIRYHFCWALDLLDIHWTQNSWHTIAVYRQADTPRLDQFIGPKC